MNIKNSIIKMLGGIPNWEADTLNKMIEMQHKESDVIYKMIKKLDEMSTVQTEIIYELKTMIEIVNKKNLFFSEIEGDKK